MKLTKKQLKQIIREEKSNLLNENRMGGIGIGFSNWSANDTADFAKAYGKDAKTINAPGFKKSPVVTETDYIRKEQEAWNSPKHIDADQALETALYEMLGSLISMNGLSEDEAADEVLQFCKDTLGY